MKMIRSAIGVALYTIFSRATGFVRDILMANYIGTSIVMDALVIAIKVPSFLRRIFAEGAFNSSFIPIFSGLLVDDKEKANNFLADVLSIMTFLLIAVVVIFEIIMPNFLSFILQNNSPEFIKLTINFSRVTFPFILLISLTALFSGVLNSFEKFTAAASSQVSGNCFIILIMLLSAPHELEQGQDVALAITGSGLVQLMWVIVPCYIYNIRPSLRIPTLTPNVRKFGRRMVPAALGAGVLQLNLLVDVYIATLLPDGTNAYLYYADRLYHLPISITGTAMGTVLLPLLSKLWRQNKSDEAQHCQNRAIEFSLLITLPAMIGLFFLSEDLVRVMFEHGKFDSTATRAVAYTVIGFSTGLPAYILAKIFNSSFFARQNTKTPIYVALGSMILNIALNILFMYFTDLRHVGIALSTSISAWVSTLALMLILKSRHEMLFDKKLFLFFGKILLSSVMMFLALYFMYDYIKDYVSVVNPLYIKVTGIIILVGVSLLVYIGVMWVLKGLKFKEYISKS